MTHEYTIATNGVILGGDGAGSTAVAWAGATILAVGSDAEVRAISRGDSTFVDLQGRAVTRGSDSRAAEAALRAAVERETVAQLLAMTDPIEVGAPADLLLWSRDPRTLEPGSASLLNLVGRVSGGRLDLSR